MPDEGKAQGVVDKPINSAEKTTTTTAPSEARRHSAAHLLALAVQEMYPGTKFGIGPAIEHGFYYDFEFKEPISSDDLTKIEDKMRVLQSEKLGFAHTEMPITEAKAWAETGNQPYKKEFIDKLAAEGETVASFYQTGNFTDLCKGPHVADTSQIGHFKLTHLAGAYWLGNENNPMLTRVYAAEFATQAELDEYLQMLEEAKKRDHRKLGRELDLFTFSDLVGAGLPLFTPKGTILRTELVKFIQELQVPLGYQPVCIPHIAKKELYETSGHWAKFKDDLFHVKGKGKDEFVMKPMNCPHHNQIYMSRNRSYRDLPIRYSEVTTCYRDELPGELNGISRVRSLTQDDGHLYLRPDQIKEEIMHLYEVVAEFYKVFNMQFKVRFSRRDRAKPEAYLGGDEIWNKAESQLKEILTERSVEYIDGPGEAAFYGPKLDFMATDALGREWQVATIQLDFNQPERFGMTYTDETGQEVRPVMIHRAIAGSIERFLAMAIEHYAGAFPLWLAPVQVAILPVSEKTGAYAEKIIEQANGAGLRAELRTDDSLGKRIRTAEMEKIPVSLIVGEKEAEAGTVSIRTLGQQDHGSHDASEVMIKLKEAAAWRSTRLPWTQLAAQPGGSSPRRP